MVLADVAGLIAAGLEPDGAQIPPAIVEAAATTGSGLLSHAFTVT